MMNHVKLISFDLQGTLSSAAFSDEFWLELLPTLYAKKHQLNLSAAKKILTDTNTALGKYHPHYYDHRIRLDAVLDTWTFQEIVGMLKNKPAIDKTMLSLIKSIPADVPVIIISSTTREFIELELGEHKVYFSNTYSSIDDFAIPGKPPVLFQKIAILQNILPKNGLHIGDCSEMDYTNAKAAGWNSYPVKKNKPKEILYLEIKNEITKLLEQ